VLILYNVDNLYMLISQLSDREIITDEIALLKLQGELHIM